MGVTPVPIPNTMVKTQAADGTALETVWESRWPPEIKKKQNQGDRKSLLRGVHIDTDEDLRGSELTRSAGKCC